MQIYGSLLARNTILNLVGQIVPGLVALVAIPILIRGLGAEGYGILSLALIVLGYFGLFDLGLGRATTKYVAEYLGREDTKEVPGLVWTSVGVQLLLGTLGGLLLAAASPFLVGRVFYIAPALVGEAKTTFFLLAASLPIVLGTVTLRGTLEAYQRFDLMNAVKIPASAATLLIPAIAASFGFRLPAIVFLLVVAQLGTAFAYLMLCLRVFPALKQSSSFRLKLLRPLLTYGSWVTVTSMVGPVLVYLDRFLIGALVSMAAVAYYAAPYQLATAFWILPAGLVAALFPAFSTLGAAGDRPVLEKLYAHALKALLLTVGPLMLFVVFFAWDILRLWLSADFAEQSSLVLQILAFGVLINSLAWVPLSLLQGLGRPDLTAKFHLLELPLYVGLVGFLVGEMGIVGAALAWTLRAGLDAALLFGACWWLKLVPMSALAQNGLWRSLVVLAALAAMLSFVFLAAGGVLTQVVLAALLVVLFVYAAGRYSLDGTDRRFLKLTITQLAATIRGRS